MPSGASSKAPTLEEQPLLSVRGLSFRYRDDQPAVLQEVSFTLQEGGWLAIVGSNGSGKSTLARHLNGLLLPTEGEVRVLGLPTVDAAAIQEIRRRVGMVFQNPDNQLVAALVEEDVAFGPENLGMPPAEMRERVAWALKTVGLWEMRDRAPSQLSGGQKQRLAIAGALAMQPRLLVLDEPTAMLDPRGAREVLQLVSELHAREGLSVVWISHRMPEIAAAREVLALERGHVAFHGTPAQFFANLKLVERLGLEQPPAAQLAGRLRAMGWPLPLEITTPAAVVTALQAARGASYS